MKQYIFLALLGLALTVSPAFAHPGNTATDGRHYCRTNCAKWGEVEGERHCHEARQSGRVIEQTQPRAEGRGLSGVPRIIDADTLEVAGQKVRLQGIDAPESAQTCRLTGGQRYQCGKQATEALRIRLGQGAVRCTIESRDRYGRGLGTCYTADGVNVNAWLVRHGHALAYRRYSTKYVPQEDQARAGRTGIWAGEFIEPWNWRRGERLE